jgi:hypothetical protein
MSHTVTIDVKIKNMEALAKAAVDMGATINGEGTHRLFSSSHAGLAIQFPKWNYPVVVGTDGTLHYDNYNGHWGNQADVDRLVNGYAQAVVEVECDNLGWYHERNEATGELVVHHPSGGTITVQSGGKLDAQGFHGTSCAEATLKLEQAMGNRLGESLKPEMNEVQLTQQELES